MRKPKNIPNQPDRRKAKPYSDYCIPDTVPAVSGVPASGTAFISGSVILHSTIKDGISLKRLEE